jgi:hypothetical protein
VIPVSELQLMHRHRGEWAPLKEAEHHSADDHDLERRLVHGGKLFQCSECDLEILVVPPQES